MFYCVWCWIVQSESRRVGRRCRRVSGGFLYSATKDRERPRALLPDPRVLRWASPKHSHGNTVIILIFRCYRGPIMLFTKSWFCWVVWKSHYFSHNVHYYNTSLPSLTPTTRLVLGLMKARLPKYVVLWLVSSLDSVIAPPLISSSILPYQFRPREYWTRGPWTFARKIYQCFCVAKSGFRCDVNNSFDYVQISATVTCIIVL